MMDHSYEDTRGPSPWYKPLTAIHGLRGINASVHKMKTRPKHQLRRVVDTIRAHQNVEMIILFGSHARGDWVEDEYEEDHITYGYHSDYDILIVTADKDRERDVNHDEKLKVALQPEGKGTRVNLIVHTIQHVNRMLPERRFFFMDILKEGGLLWDFGRYSLARPPKELPPEVMLRHSEEYFSEWMESADKFALGAELMAKHDSQSMLPSSSINPPSSTLPACSSCTPGTNPKSTTLKKLLVQAAAFDPRYTTIFPRNTGADEHLFDLLRRAYVDAGYSKRYRITDQELSIIAERIRYLRSATDDACRTKIEGLRHAADDPK